MDYKYCYRYNTGWLNIKKSKEEMYEKIVAVFGLYFVFVDIV